MNPSEAGFRRDIPELLDGRLDARRRVELQEHLEACPDCHREWRALASVKGTVRTARTEEEPPPDLVARVHTALDREDERELAGGFLPLGTRGKRLGMLAAAAAAVVAVFFLARPQRTDPFSQAARDWKSWKSGTLHLEIRSENPAALSRFFSERGIGFPVAAASLKIPGYRLIGARVHSLAGRPSAFSVYRGRDGEILVCQMYEGPLGVLPAGSRVVESGGVRVHAFERSNLSVVLWQDGPIVCALVSDGAFEDVVRLALARARERSGA